MGLPFRRIARDPSTARTLETVALVAALASCMGFAAISIFYATRWPATLALTDFHLRWQEVQYVFHGVDPRDVLLGIAPIDPAVGRPQYTYPPWSYVLGGLLIPPVSPRFALPWFVLLNVGSLALIAAENHKLGIPFGGRARLLLPLAALATLAIPINLRHLNYAIVVCGALALYVRYEEKGLPVLAGAALAFASLKPQMGALFFLIPIFCRRWRTVLVAVGVNVAATAVAALMVWKNPLALVAEMAAEGASYTDAYLGIFDMLRRAHVSRPTILLMGMTAGFIGAAVVLHFFRGRPVRTLVGVVACITTLWTYQRTMDLLILSFLVSPLGLRAYRSRSTSDWMVFVVVAGSFWFPYLVRIAAMPIVPELFRAIWVLGAVHLLRREEAGAPAAGARPVALAS